jgi:hypothetical protein
MNGSPINPDHNHQPHDPKPHTPEAAGPRLTLGDQAALDALVDAGMSLDALSPSLHPRAGSILNLLSTLSSTAAPADPLLADLAHLRVMREAEKQHALAHALPVLTPSDEEALDAWAMAGFDAERVSSALRPRARAHQSLRTLVTTSAPSDLSSASLLERTLASIQTAESHRRERLRLNPERPSRRLRIRMADVVSVAAMLLIGTAVAWPIVAAGRENARQALCNANLGSTALALASYGASNRDAFPVANAGFGGGSWWNVGKSPRNSNSANLFTLFTNGYLELDDLACPGNPNAATDPTETSPFDWRQIEQISYSYQITPPGGFPAMHDAPRRVILADRSPVILLAIRGQTIDPSGTSPNHTRRGQHLLHADGSTDWAKSPVLAETDDNIWLPRAIEDQIRTLSNQRSKSRHEPLKGNELPASADDVFLGP